MPGACLLVELVFFRVQLTGSWEPYSIFHHRLEFRGIYFSGTTWGMAGGGGMQYWVAETFHCLGNRGTSKFISGKQWNQYQPLGDMCVA